MGDREQAISYLSEVKKDMLTRREKLLLPLQQLDKELEHVSATLAIVLGQAKNEKDIAMEFPIAKLRGLSQPQALLAIAKHNNGLVKTQEAKRLMIVAGIMRPTKNSTGVTYNLIKRSEKFVRVGPGEYRLKDFSSKPNNSLEGVPLQ